MSRTRHFLGGVSFGYLNQFTVTVAGLWLTPFLLQRVGQSDYGLWLVGTQLAAYLMLFDFGIVALLPRETAHATGRRLAAAGAGAEELPLLVGQTARLVLWQMPLVVCAAVLFWLLMPSEWEPLRRPFGVVLVAMVAGFPLRVFQAVLQGLQDLKFLAKAHMGVWVLSTALTVGLVIAGFGLYALAAGWVASQVLTTLVAVGRARRRFPEVLPRRLPRLSWAEARRKLGSGLWASVSQVAVVLLVGTDMLVVGRVLGPEAVVVYACTYKLALVLANQPQLLLQSALPGLSELRAGASREHLSSVCASLNQAMLLLSGAVVCVVLAVNRGFVAWWVGAEQYGGFLLTCLVLVNMLLRHWNLTLGIILFSLGFEKRLALTGLLDGVVTVGAGVVLTLLIGPAGAPLGSVVGLCAVSLPGNTSALAAAGAVSVPALWRSLGPWFWRFAALACACGVFAQHFVPATFPTLAATAVVVACVYAALMLPVALRDPLGSYVRPRLPSFGKRLFRAARLMGPA